MIKGKEIEIFIPLPIIVIDFPSTSSLRNLCIKVF